MSSYALKNLREKSGISLNNMAKMLDISKSYYFQIEEKEKRLCYDMAKKIAAVFGLKPDDIFYEEYKETN